jgi:hypothetical protein
VPALPGGAPTRLIFTSGALDFVCSLIAADEFGKALFFECGMGEMVDCEICGLDDALNFLFAFGAYGKVFAFEFLVDFKLLLASLSGLTDMFVDVNGHYKMILHRWG